MTRLYRRSLQCAPAFGIIATMLAASPAAAQQAIVVATGTTDTTPKTVGGTDTVTVQTGGTLSTSSNPTINWNTSSTDLRITNSGIIRSTANGGRAIGTSGAANARTVTLTNNAGALIESQDDAFRINVNAPSGTIIVNNAGTIRTTNGGQALDFDGIANPAVSVTINNLAGGVLQSVGQDAIRPGQGAVVNNAGMIFSDGLPNNSFDGVDWQQRAGMVNNAASGTISGLRHGITSDVNVTVTNDGTITGRNGSGIGSDGAGTVLNRGTITGMYDGVAINGDGDGVDIDFIGTVRNFGTIQGIGAAGVDSGGRPNSAQGVAMGGGLIENNTGATISGTAQGVLINHDTNPGGVADGATVIVNAGTIRGTTAHAIQLVGTFDDVLTNSGTITGGAGLGIDFGAGNDTLNLLAGSVITGSVDGGAGTDIVNLGGTGGSFAGAVNFEQLRVNTGSWSLTAASTFSGGTAVTSGAALTGTAATLTGAIANAGTLTVDQPTNAAFAATLTGAGALVKAGSGTLSIGTQAGFTGATRVNAGRLDVIGVLTSPVTVVGGTLGGTGTVGATTVQTGATIAPGLSIGTLNVAGNFVQATGSTYAAETSAAGMADLIAVTGTATIQNGTTLALTRDTGVYTIGTSYTLLTATGGITGSYTTITQPVAGGVELRQRVIGNMLTVQVARSGAALGTAAQTRNQTGVAAGITPLGAGNAAYAAVTLLADDAATRAGLDALSGEVHPTLHTTMVKDVLFAESAVTARIDGHAAKDGSEMPFTIWGQFVGGEGSDRARSDGIASADRDTLGGFGGVETTFGNGTMAGIGGGYTRTNVDIDARASTARSESYHAFGYIGAHAGPIVIRAGIGYAWSDIDTRRAVAFTGFADALTANYDGETLHVFGQAGYEMALGGFTLEPYIGLASVRSRTDAFVESGGAAALAGGRNTQVVTISSVGLKGEASLGKGLGLKGGIAWQHGYENIRPDSVLRFAAGTTPFAVGGASLSRNAAAPSLDLTWQPTPMIRVAAGYAGSFGDNGYDNGGRLTVSVGF